jgi:23S rRNA (adenine2030-N6)-methyltransferase
MNYRHAYHAGNFADVVKHVVLARLLEYDLSSVEAQKTGEWQGGIGRLIDAELDARVAALLVPYLEVVRELNPNGGVKTYPGSPLIARHLLRKQDRLTAIELHPQDAGRLKAVLAGDFQVRVIELDGWLALGAHLPPKEKRGIVLVDPPFEEEGEYDRLIDGLEKAWRRFPGGTYCLWYPLKKDAPIRAFHEGLQALEIPKMLCAELTVKSDRHETGLTGSGLIVVNPPFTLKDELHALLPALKDILTQDRFASHRAFWLRGEA